MTPMIEAVVVIAGRFGAFTPKRAISSRGWRRIGTMVVRWPGPVLAATLNLGRAEVHGVISFYHDFREAPAGRHVLKICRAEACQSMGANALAAATLAKLGLDWHGTTPNGAVTVEPVYCLGLCACAPAAMIDGRVVGRVDTARMARILHEAGA